MALTGLRSFQFCRDQRSVAFSLILATLLWSRRIGVHQVLYMFALFFGGRLDANVVFKNGVFLRTNEFLNSLFTSAYRGLI